MSERFDYIVLGAGCSGLSLVMHLLASPALGGKTILLVDKEPKSHNDRTWCFWEKGSGFFEPVVCKSWENLSVSSEQSTLHLHTAPYRYKMIRGIDFYNYCFHTIRQHPRVTVRFGQVSFRSARNASSGQGHKEDGLFLNGLPLSRDGALVFNSIFHEGAADPGRYHLWQHFKGWQIRTPPGTFDPSKATLMDFRVSQQEGAAFVYVLPLSDDKALVEYTLFSRQLLPPGAYDAGLASYCRDYLGLSAPEILEEEWGKIPMTDAVYPFQYAGNYQIGTAGGRTKPSTGYTFRYIQKQSARIAGQLAAGVAPSEERISGRFRFYDRVLLSLLQREDAPGKEIFTRLFSQNPLQRIFRFLDNETTPGEDLRLMSTVDKTLFVPAALREWLF